MPLSRGTIAPFRGTARGSDVQADDLRNTAVDPSTTATGPARIAIGPENTATVPQARAADPQFPAVKPKFRAASRRVNATVPRFRATVLRHYGLKIMYLCKTLQDSALHTLQPKISRASNARQQPLIEQE